MITVLDAATGAQDSCKQYESESCIPLYLPEYTTTTTPVVVAGILYVGHDGNKFFRINATGGDIQWTYDLPANRARPRSRMVSCTSAVPSTKVRSCTPSMRRQGSRSGSTPSRRAR